MTSIGPQLNRHRCLTNSTVIKMSEQQLGPSNLYPSNRGLFLSRAVPPHHSADAQESQFNCLCSPNQKGLSNDIFPTIPSSLGVIPSNTPSLDSIPPELIDMILDMVYEEEETSRDLCCCYRPRTEYEELKETTLEHRIANTAILRSTCPAFHAWAVRRHVSSRL